MPSVLLRGVAALFLVIPGAIRAADWAPIEPADLALKAGRVDKDAAAEALFWEIRVQDDVVGDLTEINLNHYLRIKIFSEKGLEEATAKLYFNNSVSVSHVMGRTVKPDGREIELGKDAVFTSNVVKTSEGKLKVRSFALPNVEVGDIIEYKWRETRNNQISNHLTLPLQRDIPVERVRYVIKPLEKKYTNYGLRAYFFNEPVKAFDKQKDDFYAIEYTNMPAFQEENYMPREDAVRAAIMLYYTPEWTMGVEAFWEEHGKGVYRATKERMKINGDIKRAAQEATSGASTDIDKLHGIFAYCRKNVRNTASKAGDVSPEDLRKFKENIYVADTLKHGIGDGEDINMLFATIAQAAGFDARIVVIEDGSTAMFRPPVAEAYFVSGRSVAIKVGEAWKFFDPGTIGVPFGMLRWQEEGQRALLTDPKSPTWIPASVTAASASIEKYTGQLALAADGSLEGDVRLERTGHLAWLERVDLVEQAEAEREKGFLDSIHEYSATAEVTQVKYENVADIEKPLVVTFHVKLPGYAARTGKRLVLQPAVFHANRPATFASAARKYPVFFRYSWTEEDHFTISVPAGFALENGQMPAPLAIGKVIGYELKSGLVDGKLVCDRKFFMGRGGLMAVPADNYKIMKRAFDAVQDGDNFGQTFKVVQ